MVRSLVERLRSVQQLQDEAVADRTLRSYKLVRREFRVFCHTTLERVPELTIENVMLFLEDRFDRGYAPATIRSALSALAFYAKKLHQPNPSDDSRVQALLSGIERRRGSPDTRLPFAPNHLHQIIEIWREDAAIRDDHLLYTTVLLVSFYSMLRISEVCAPALTDTRQVLKVRDVSPTDQGYQLILRHFKHNRTARPHCVEITMVHDNPDYDPVASLKKYIQLRPGSKQSPLFRDRSGTVLRQSQMRQALQRAIQTLVLDGRYTFHSLRIGGASFYAAKGWDESRIKRMGRWASNAYIKYIRQS